MTENTWRECSNELGIVRAERDELRETVKELMLKVHELEVHFALWTGEAFTYSMLKLEASDD